MEHVEKIAKAVGPFGLTGISPLHETGLPAVIFTTDCGKVYRIDFDKLPDDEGCTKIAAEIERATGLHVDWYGPTRGEDERSEAMRQRDEASRKASAEDTAKTKPVDTQASHKAQLAQMGGKP